MKFILAFFLILMVAVAGSLRAGEPRIEHKLGLDSTFFTMTLDQKHRPKPGGTFEITIHVTPGHDWHVYSTKMSTDGGLVPLTLVVPPELSDFFEIQSLTETGDIKTAYDSNFDAVTMAHFAPFDVIATIKVKAKPKIDSPFYLLVHFQTCNESMCMPPRTFEVPMTFLGQQPIMLQIAGTMKSASQHLTSILHTQ